MSHNEKDILTWTAGYESNPYMTVGIRAANHDLTDVGKKHLRR